MFYKLTPKEPTMGAKSKFIWFDEEPCEFTLGMLELSSGFYNGIESCVPASKNDSDFRSYVEYDLKKVQEEIDKLTKLKDRLDKVLL